MAMTRRPASKKGDDKSSKDGKKSLPPWLQKKAPAKGTKGGKAPKSSNPFKKRD